MGGAASKCGQRRGGFSGFATHGGGPGRDAARRHMAKADEACSGAEQERRWEALGVAGAGGGGAEKLGQGEPRRAEVRRLKSGAVYVARRWREEDGVHARSGSVGPGRAGRGWAPGVGEVHRGQRCSGWRGAWRLRCLVGMEVEMEFDLIFGVAGCVGVVCSFLRLHR